MNDNMKIAIAVVGIIVAVLLAFVMGTFWLLLHQQPAAPITYIQYNNTTTIQYPCCELKVNCSATPVPTENVTISYAPYKEEYTSEPSYYNPEEPTPTQTPLATPEFPFLPL